MARSPAPREAGLALLVADVFECAGALRRVGDDLAGPAGQSQARWQVLSVLSEGDWTAASAARRLGVSRQAVQRIADVLEDEGLVRREPNPHHRRAALLRLTEAGRATLAEVMEGAHAWHRQAAAGLSVEELEATRRVLRAITERCRA